MFRQTLRKFSRPVSFSASSARAALRPETNTLSLKANGLSKDAMTTQYLARPEGLIAFDDSGGNGALVLMVPGLGDIRQEYRYLQRDLIGAGYRVVTMDLRGHGESDATFSDHTPEGVGSDTVALLEQLDARNSTVISTSFGAAAGVYAAAEAPERVAKLVLIGPFVRDLPPKPLQTLMMRLLFAQPWGASAWSMYYNTLYPTVKPADFAVYRQRLAAKLREPGRMQAMRATLFTGRRATQARLARVSAPTLVVMGSKDPDFTDPAAEARTVAELIRGQVALIDGAGHYPHAEMPDITSPIIRSFLER